MMTAIRIIKLGGIDDGNYDHENNGMVVLTKITRISALVVM